MKELDINEMEKVNGGDYIYDAPKVDKDTAKIVKDLMNVAKSLGYKTGDEFIDKMLKLVMPIEQMNHVEEYARDLWDRG